MNTPEATAIVELVCGKKSDDAHWQNLISYCSQGNLQAVFDEYAHLISSGIDHDEALIEQIHRQIISAMDIRTTQYGVDTFLSFQKRISGQRDRIPLPEKRYFHYSGLPCFLAGYYDIFRPAFVSLAGRVLCPCWPVTVTFCTDARKALK